MSSKLKPSPEPKPSPVDVDDVSRLRLYARCALAAQPQDARAAVFGDMLATCAHCHATLRDR